MITVVDTSPLNDLILIEAVEVLPRIFGQVHVPPEVMQELGASKSPELEVVRRWAASPPAWLTIRAPRQIDPSIHLGKGGTAAISLAQELGADWILIDERKGTREARDRGLQVAGTIVIEEAGVRDLIDYETMRDRLVHHNSFYVTEDVIRDSEERYRLRKIAQEPQSGQETKPAP
jgi:predicted nucleic acid-binding protein